MATTEDGTGAKLERLRELREEALHAGSPAAIERHRAAGKLLARERAERLLDPGSFFELDRYVRHRTAEFGMLERRPYGDAVVTGYGTVFGRRVFVFSQDFTVFGGSLSEVFAEKICKVMDLAAKYGCPLIGINDSGGARIQEGVVSLAGYAEIFWRNVQCSGVIPQLSLVMGPCAGGAVYSPAITDFVLMVEGSSYMFITGPDVVKTVTGEEVSFEELGGAATHAARSGVAQLIAPDEESCLDDARLLLSYLPQNNLEPAPYAPPTDPVDRESPELDGLVPDSPNKPYDIKSAITGVVDDGLFLEVHERFAPNIVCGFARLGGHSVGVVGNQPRSLAGVLDIDSSVKAARFVRTCDAFNIPLVTFVDVPGFLPGTAQEWG
ncbi:MAG: acyl-CoA carboxylase subunit beta, partial [Actinobacteria bacterium]|nr:acyl-CoA carboxylase subunit beta [Actinomycetota bacterium]